MKKISLFAAVIAFAAIFSGCSKNKSGPSTTATVMFVNGCPGAAGMYTQVNGKNVGSNNINFLGNSGYQTVTAGSETISFYLTGAAAGTLLSTGAPTLTAGNRYSIFVGGIFTSPLFVPVTDDLTSPASGNAKVRFINLSGDALNETFSIGTQEIDSNSTSTHCSPFYQVTAGSYAIKAVDPAHTAFAVVTPSMTLSAGKIYTVMLTGSETAISPSTSVLTLTVIGNN